VYPTLWSCRLPLIFFLGSIKRGEGAGIEDCGREVPRLDGLTRLPDVGLLFVGETRLLPVLALTARSCCDSLLATGERAGGAERCGGEGDPPFPAPVWLLKVRAVL
jgi:hypothetical protein